MTHRFLASFVQNQMGVSRLFISRQGNFWKVDQAGHELLNLSAAHFHAMAQAVKADISWAVSSTKRNTELINSGWRQVTGVATATFESKNLSLPKFSILNNMCTGHRRAAFRD